jgi:S1-C subfamily serine protease
MTGLAEFSASISAIVSAAQPGIAAIHGRRTRASGFVWKPGLIVTAEEAIHGDGPFEVVIGGKARKAELRGRDPSTDVALLKLDAEAGVAAVFGPAPAAGAIVIAMGATDGDTISAMGSVARSGAAWQSLRGGDIDARLELDLRLRGSMQGGLAFNAEGQAFGMTVLGPRRRTLVIPAPTIERVAAKLLEQGRIPRGYLGLSLQIVKIDGQDARGSIIVGVDPNGPGAAAGLKQGDVLVSWNGVPAADAEPLSKALGPASVGRTVDFGVKRAGQSQTVRVTIGERPAA